MSLFSDWRELLEGQTEETFRDFWKEYSDAEIKIYSDILKNHPDSFDGKYSELAEKYEVRPIIFMGFVDGVETSLKNKIDLDAIDEDSDLHFEIDYRLLFFNMLKADADHLVSLPEWDEVLDDMEKIAIIREYKRSKTVRRDKAKIGRNDPCPCGSGKKYKNCCGKAV